MDAVSLAGDRGIEIKNGVISCWGDNPLLPISAIVTDLCEEFADCVTLTARTEDIRMEWEPGQFFMVSVPGVGEVPISVSGAGEGDSTVQFTILGVGPVTRRLCEQREGDTIGLRGPFGTGWPLDVLHGHDVVLVAGGLGMAPLRPVVLSILERPIAAESLTILCGARTPSSLLFGCELGQWERTAGVSVAAVVEQPSRTWQGRHGLVTDLIADGDFSLSHTIALICGPEAMMRAAAETLEHHGVSPDKIYLAMERNMQCGVGWCGRCQLGPVLLCRDGPVLSYDRVSRLLSIPRV